MLNHFRLINSSDLRKLERDLKIPAVYAMCFDLAGQLTRIGWSSYPGQRIANVIREQAADVIELWVAEIPVDEFFDSAFDYNRENAVRRFGRHVQNCLRESRVRNELFRVSMRHVDDAFHTTAKSVCTPIKAAA